MLVDEESYAWSLILKAKANLSELVNCKKQEKITVTWYVVCVILLVQVIIINQSKNNLISLQETRVDHDCKYHIPPKKIERKRISQ